MQITIHDAADRLTSHVRSVWLVARWEFLSIVLRGSFLAGALVLPLVHLGIAALLGLAVRAGDREAKPTGIAVVDTARLLVESPGGGDVVERDEAQALARLRAGSLDAVFVLADDYLETGRVRAYVQRKPSLFVFADNVARRDRAAAVIRRGLAASYAPPALARRIAEPAAVVERFTLDRSGRTLADVSSLGFVGGAFGLCFLLSLSIFFSSGLLQQAMAAERQNHVLEVVLSLIPPLPLLAGKVIGLAAVSLMQMGVYLALMLGAAPVALGMFDIPGTIIASSIACCVVGYVFYACLMAATGALGRDTHESAQLAMPLMLVAAAPLFLIVAIGGQPTSAIARALSWVPLTSPVTLLLRLGAGGVSTIELTGGLLLTLVSSAGVLIAASWLVGRLAGSGGTPVLSWLRRQ